MRYKIEYDGKHLWRRGDNAFEAVQRLCRQYGWSAKLVQHDAEEKGNLWAECLIDKEGGINYSLRLMASYEPKLYYINEGIDPTTVFGTEEPYCFGEDELFTLSKKWGVDKRGRKLEANVHEATPMEITFYGFKY